MATKSDKSAKPTSAEVKAGYSLVLRCNSASNTSRNNFQWPEVGGTATAPDWIASEKCGNGLHGWLNGVGDITVSQHYEDEDAKWLVLEVPTEGIVDLKNKVKFQSAKVLFIGSMQEASAYLVANSSEAKYLPVIGKVEIGGYRSTVKGGDSSTVKGGDSSTVTGGDSSTVKGGDSSTVKGGDSSTVTGGYRSTVTGGYRSTVTGGYRSTVTGGEYSTVTGGEYSTVTGGDDSILTIYYWKGRKRSVTAYVGEDGIKANTKYKLNAEFKFEEVVEVK